MMKFKVTKFTYLKYTAEQLVNKGYRYIGIDMDGAVYAYVGLPEIYQNVFIYNHTLTKIIYIGRCEYVGNWKESLKDLGVRYEG